MAKIIKRLFWFAIREPFASQFVYIAATVIRLTVPLTASKDGQPRRSVMMDHRARRAVVSNFGLVSSTLL